MNNSPTRFWTLQEHETIPMKKKNTQKNNYNDQLIPHNINKKKMLTTYSSTQCMRHHMDLRKCQ